MLLSHYVHIKASLQVKTVTLQKEVIFKLTRSKGKCQRYRVAVAINYYEVSDNCRIAIKVIFE